MLTAMGAQIAGAGTDRIEIEGVATLRGVDHTRLGRPHRGRHAARGAVSITRGDVTVRGADPTLLDATLEKLREAGAEVEVDGDAIRCARTSRRAASRS